jgi:hypothetical protein
MLAPRVLHFTHDQIFWDCGTLSACETLPSGLPLPLDDAAATDRHWRGRLQESSSLAHAPLSGANDDSLEGFWSSSVSNYTRCNLTNQGDKSVAIWSIAKLVRDAWNDEYGAGLWGAGLEEQLNWRVVDMTASKRDMQLQWKQPSWSWTSIQGAVKLPERMTVKRCFRVKGHDGSPISFKTNEATRPTAERVHSDSQREDIELGWKEWQKKTRTQSSPQVRKNIREERTQSMPVSQTSTAKPTAPGPKRNFEPKVDLRDLEPKLESKSIAVRAPLGLGFLHPNADAGSYTFKVDRKTESIDGQDSVPEILFEAWPDETPNDLDLSPHPAHFLILTITAHSTAVTPSGLGIDMYEDDSDYASDNEPEVPSQTTYSGTGLLLIQSEEYLRRGDFYTEAKRAREKLSEYLANTGPIEQGSGEEWTAKGMQGDVDALDGVIEQVVRHSETGERHGHFRRTGVLEFRDWDETAYSEMVHGRMADVWLD